MKLKRIARLFAIVLTLVTMVSCLAVFMATDAYAGNYMVFTGADLNSKWSGANGISKSLSGTELTVTANDNDPYFQISGVSDTVLRTYPYVVVRYKSDHLGTFEFFSGHPNVDSCRVSAPVVPTNGQWGCLFYDFSVLDTNKKSWFRIEPMTVKGEKLTIGEIVFFTDQADADKYGYAYANAGYRSGATGGCLVLTHNDFDYWGNANGRSGEAGLQSINIARKNDGYYKDGGYYTRITAGGGDPYVHFNNNTTIKNAATSYTYVSVRYRASNSGTMKVYTEWDENYAKTASVTGDQTWRWATITLKDDGAAGTFRIDPLDSSASGQWVDIAEIVFHNGTNNIYNADFGNSSDRNNNNDGRKYNVRMYCLHRDSNTYFTSVGTISGGTLNGNQRSATGSNFQYGTTALTTVGRTFYVVAGTHSAHTANSGTVTVQATCTTAGTTRYNCTACNDVTSTNTSLPAALGHNGGAAATCTTAQTCTRCSAQLAAALGHNSEGSVAHKDATCTETGVAGGTYCARCNEGKTVAEAILAALGHNAEGTVVHKDPTCTETGVVGGTYCARCNDGKTAVEAIIEALGHNAEGSVAHKDATCTETGVVGGTYCDRCNNGKTAVEAIIEALGHDEVVDAAKDPTCTATGLKEGKHCDRCKAVLIAQAIVDALGHAEVTDAAKAPTCTETGLTEGCHCSRCSTVLTAQETVAALGHNKVTDAAKDPTCTETGLTEGNHCGRCSVVLLAQEIVKALGHAEVTDAAKAPTCTETGLTEGCHCSRCEEVLTKQNVVDALGHDEKIDAAVAPYCTTTGKTEGKHCDRCKVTLIAQEIVAALGHVNVVDKAVDATCTETGLTEGCHCSRCEEVLTKQNVVDALGHAEVVDAAVAPDCTNTGKTEGKHCDRCEAILIAQNIVNALGHNEITDEAVAATCTATGLTAGCHCDRCDIVLIDQEVVAALGHELIVKPGKPASYTETGLSDGTKCSRCTEMDSEQSVLAKLNPLLNYNVALGEQFAVNMKYIAFEGATITVVDEEGTAYEFTVTDTGAKHTDGNPIWSIRIANISAKNIGHVFTIGESKSEHSSHVSIEGYCAATQELYAGKTESEIADMFVAAGYEQATAQAMAKKQVLAVTATQNISIYGQAAKNYFNQSGANHTELKDKIDQLGDGGNTNYQVSTTVKELSNSGEVKFTGATVVFGDEVELLFKMANYKNEQIYVNGEMIPEDEIKSHLSTDGTYVYFSLIVRPDQFSTEFNIRAGSWLNHSYFGTSSNITYSVDTYIANMQAKYANDQSEKGLATMNLVNALGYYGQAATEYKNG